MIDQVALNDVLLAGAKEIFETMVFMSVEESSEQGQEIEGDALLGSITFKGSIEGCLAICCSVPCAKTIATNMLGMDISEEISKPEICDAIGEVTNMIMGSVKSRILEGIGNLEVSIPSVVSGRKLENSLGDRANKISVKVSVEDEYTAELVLLYREASK